MKCLVRKLGVVINNNELPLFNAKVFSFSKSVSKEAIVFAIKEGFNGELTFNGATITDKSGTSTLSSPINIPTNENNYLLVTTTSSPGKATISNFDKLRMFDTRWAFTKINVIEFAKCLYLTRLGHDGGNFMGEVRDLAEKQIEYGRTSGVLNVTGQYITIDGVSGKTSATITYNSATSYSIDENTWNFVNGLWIKS